MPIFSWKNLSTALLLGLFLIFLSACGNNNNDESAAVVEITLAGSKSSFIADGQDSVTLTATVTENSQAAQGQTVTFSIRSGTGTLSTTSATTTANGTARTTLTATQSGSLTVQAVLASDLTKTANATFTATPKGAVTPASADLQSVDQRLDPATQESIISTFVVDKTTGLPLANVPVRFESTNQGITFTPAAVLVVNTDTQGRAQTRVQGNSTSTIVVTITIVGIQQDESIGNIVNRVISLPPNPGVTPTPPTPTPPTPTPPTPTPPTPTPPTPTPIIFSLSQFNSSKTQIEATGTDNVTLTALVVDANNNQPLANVSVTFSSNNGGNFSPSAIIPTNASGQAVVTFTSNIAGNTSITASINAIPSGIPSRSVNMAVVTPLRFTLQLLHVGDPEIGGVQDLRDVNNFAKLLNAFKTTYTGSTVVISSGDNFIPGPATTASADPSMATLLGRAGQAYADIVLMNAMGFEVSVLGNHDLDFGTTIFSEIITANGAYTGTRFPYLSSNLDFSTDSNTADNITPDGQACNQGSNKLARSCVITLPNGVKVGVVGATTPTVDVITSIGGINVFPANDNITELVRNHIQPAVDALTTQGIHVIILTSHMQQLQIEADQIAPLLKNVDIIIGGGSNTVLLDANDRVNPLGGTPSAQYSYPIQRKDANNQDILVVNTDGNYNYLGRLVIDFVDGKVQPASYNATISGGFSTNDSDLSALNRLGLTPSENTHVREITEALIRIIQVKDNNIVGLSSVFLNGERGSVRTEETNFGNLTADANLWYARQFDRNTAISLKNGGGIRASIGTTSVPTGSTNPNDFQRLPRANNSVTQLDLENTLRFNNDLTIVTVTAERIRTLLEHSVADSRIGRTPGRFPQVAGIEFSFDETRAAGSRILNLVLVNDRGVPYDVIVENGQLKGDPNRSYRLVTLGFLANGGDGYPFGTLVNPRPLLQTGTASSGVAFANVGTEQRALAEFLNTFHGTMPFNMPEVGVAHDTRIQQFARNGSQDSVTSVTMTQAPIVLQAIGNLDNLGDIEVSTFDAKRQRIYTVSSGNPVAIQVIDASDLSNLRLNAPLTTTISNAMVNFFATANGYAPNSVAYHNDLIAVAAGRSGLPSTDPAYNPAVDSKVAPGKLFLFNADTGALLASADTDALPDMVTFTPDGQRLLVANEGEPLDPGNIGDLNNLGYDPIGSVQVFDRRGSLITRISFSHAIAASSIGLPNGVRIHPLNDPNNPAFPNADPGLDIEPEYITINAEGSRAYVSLQENNAIAVIELTAQPRFSSIFGLGVVDYGNQDIDASDRDAGFIFHRYPGLFGMYMPDGIRHFRPYMLDRSNRCIETPGEGFIALAGEGDARDIDEVRARDLDYDAAFPSLAVVGNDALLGRLNVSPLEDADGFQNVLYTLGSRSLALYDLDAGRVVGDTQEDSDRISEIAQTRSDSRSDNKGPEPEDVEIFHLPGKPCPRTFAAVGLERALGLMVYEVTDPRMPRFVQYVATGTEPEGVKFVSAADSPNGMPFLIITNTSSRNIRIVSIDASRL